ncbi:MAG: GMC family oxidoreductase [Candidatus Sulfotelmatobacter sp.]
MMQQPDVLVIGSGVGGGTLASRLVQHGFHVTILERGGFLPQEDENWNVSAVFSDLRYVPQETWVDKDGNAFRPGTYYYVGGSSKMFGAVMIRFREADFEELVHEGGISPEWPIKYPDLEPYYALAEKMYCVHGTAGVDPTEPPGVPPYPFPALPNEPAIQEVHEALKAAGIAFSPLPVAVQRDGTGNCVRCMTCDGFPCKVHAKTDAEVAAVRPALATGRLTLITDAKVTRLYLSADGSKVESVVYETKGDSETISAPVIVLSASAVNSAVLLLNSACPQAPDGVANSSGVVGRNYMAHNNTALMCVGMKRNPTKFQKTICINDFYFGDADFKFPMGNVQGLGKLQEEMLTLKVKAMPGFIARFLAERSVDWWVMSEDLPDPENRVLVRDGKIHLIYTNKNMKAHRRLVKRMIKLMRRLGFGLNLPYHMTGLSVSHQCGTVRFGNDPKTAALDPFCRAFDHRNLFVVDASFFPSSAAANPALTIAAQALRVADHIATVDFAGKSNTVSGQSLEHVPPLTMRAQELVTLPD